MRTYRHLFLALLASVALMGCKEKEVKAPEPIGPLPLPQQVEWQKMERYAFVHFGLNTFNDREWGYGEDKDLSSFNPTKLDCEQWAKTFVAAGMKGVIITAKHHDGFCLWPTQLTEYSIRNTPYKGGKGDVVGELAAACKKYGLKFGVYLSPWDRNHAQYGSQEYVEYYYKELRELLTSYGDIFEVWLDGANGGDGYYGGARETRKIDRRTYYNYPKIHEIVKELQPQAIIFSDGGPGCRWVGNERGFANATNWSFLRSKDVYPGYPKGFELTSGHEDGDAWIPAECDVSIRPGWFYHENQDDKVKNVDQLTDLYYRSVGHNANMLLNFPVDKEGLVHPIDSANVIAFYKNIQEQLKTNVLAGVVPKVSNTRGGTFKAKALTDGDYDTYWATDDEVTAATITFTMPEKTKMNRLMLQEYIPLGQRVKSFSVSYFDNGKWLPIKLMEETTTIGFKRLLRFQTIETNKIRIEINDARGSICLNNIEAFYAGETTDISFEEKLEDIQSLPLTLVGVDESEAAKATDKNASTVCFVDGNTVVFDLGEEKAFRSFFYLPNQEVDFKGVVTHYELAVGSTPETTNKVVAKGEFANIKNNPILQSFYFAPTKARYVQLKAIKLVQKDNTIGIAEIGIQ